METHNLMKAMQDKMAADHRTRERILARVGLLERAKEAMNKEMDRDQARIKYLEVTMAKVQKQQEMDLNSRVEDLRAIYKKMETLGLVK